MANSIPIFLASDNNYAPFVATTIASICDNTKSFCDFYILDGGITQENQDKICELKNQFSNFSIEFIKIDLEKEFSSIKYQNTATHVTLSTYNRFLIPTIKPNIQKAIYLDVDIIAFGDIAELYNENLNKYALGAIWREFDKEYDSTRCIKLGLSNTHKYFNAGVLLIDCEKWRKENICAKLFETEEKYRSIISLADQDVLNIYFKEYQALNPCYNFQTQYYDYFKNKENKIILRHFSDSIKPWHISENSNTTLMPDLKYFWKYAQMTDFCNRIKDEFENKEALRQLQLHSMLRKLKK